VDERPLRTLQHLLVCPACKGGLDFSPGLIRCNSCGLRFPQSRNDCFDLLSHHLLENRENQWGERQQEMEEWYKDLLASPAVANDCFAKDYTPYAPFLATLSGDVLDVGGGVGIVRDYLPRNTQYTVIDPSLEWLGSEWTSLTERFPSLETKPRFVRGIGEYLPFAAQAFDTVLAFWSLNHAHDPGLVFSEVHRVLRSSGRFLVVLEDMAPSWGDIADGTFPVSRVAPGGGDPSMENPAHLISGHEWPLQSDHIRIRESDIQRWTSQRFEVARREWIYHYLTFEFSKIESLQRTRAGTKDAEAQQNQYRIHTLQSERRNFVQQLQELESTLVKEQSERRNFVQQLQTREQQLQELESALLKERQKVKRLRKRTQRLTQQLQNIQGSRTWRLLKRLGRIRAEVLGKSRR
jgi:SAM-dependent methyltransferase